MKTSNSLSTSFSSNLLLPIGLEGVMVSAEVEDDVGAGLLGGSFLADSIVRFGAVCNCNVGITFGGFGWEAAVRDGGAGGGPWVGSLGGKITGGTVLFAGAACAFGGRYGRVFRNQSRCSERLFFVIAAPPNHCGLENSLSGFVVAVMMAGKVRCDSFRLR